MPKAAIRSLENERVFKGNIDYCYE